MKFEICSTNWWEVQELIEHYPCLSDFQLEIDKHESPKKVATRNKDGNTVMYEYDCSLVYTPYIHINSLDDLIRLSEATEHKLIFFGRDSRIEIYDGYRE